jgi:hypothetical protein
VRFFLDANYFRRYCHIEMRGRCPVDHPEIEAQARCARDIRSCLHQKISVCIARLFSEAICQRRNTLNRFTTIRVMLGHVTNEEGSASRSLLTRPDAI